MTVAQAQHELWTRLLSGQVTEVFMLGGPMTTELPQTLGLEPICYPAYRYTPDGIARTGGELADLAQELAASKRWIAEGEAPAWAPAFLEQAQVILLFDLFGRYLRVGVDPLERNGDVPVVLARYARQWFARRFKRRASDDEMDRVLTDQPWAARRRDPVRDLVELARLRYPEKLLRVATHPQRQTLRALRVPGPGETGPRFIRPR
jgi:hypothetical protein